MWKLFTKEFFHKKSTSQYGLNPHCKTYRKPICIGKREKQIDQHKKFIDKNREKEQDYQIKNHEKSKKHQFYS